MRFLMTDPMIALRSIWAGLQLGIPKPFTLPLIVNPTASIEKQNGARVELGGRFYLGVWPESNEQPSLEEAVRTGIGPPPSQRTALHLDQEARLVTEGWTVMGPGTQVVIGARGELRIGADTYLSGNAQILVRQRVTIGSGCSFAWGLMVMDSDSHTFSVRGQQRPQTTPVEIGNHVWIGAGVMILKGAKIGDGAVIAAGSLVTGEVPPRCIAAGRPARVIKEDVVWQ